MPSKRQVLEQLKRDELVTVLDELGLGVEDRRQKSLLIDALADATAVSGGEILERFRRDRLQEICRGLRLDDTGTRAGLVNRLVQEGVVDRTRGGQRSLLITAVSFTVDTHIFQELGELLVGRDSTALVELIKNAYDADAEEVVVYGEALGNPKLGYIQVIDRHGNGMNQEEFVNGFLRIASRLKVTGERRSRRHRRRYTGAKGIGRLAAHKLARVMEVFTVPWVERPRGKRRALKAVIDWDEVEACETFDDLAEKEAILLETFEVPAKTPGGTEITLRRLRGKWSPAERTRFIDEVQTFQPAPFIIKPIRDLVAEKLLFDDVTVRGETKTTDPGFQVRPEGEFKTGEDYWAAIAQAANWIVEIEAMPGTGLVRYGIAPTRTMLRDTPEAEVSRYELPHRAPPEGPFFQARILIRDPQKGTREMREWARRVTGVRVFVEGFRVPPYGEKGNDWLEIETDYNRRSRPLQRLADLGFAAYPDQGLSQLPSNSYLGAVFLTQDGASGLRPLVNREGFVPDPAYHRLTEMVRIGIDLATRHRAALSHKIGKPRRQKASASNEPERPTAGQALAESLEDVMSLYRSVRESVAAGDIERSAQILEQLEQRLREVEESRSEAVKEATMLQVVASLGTQMASFVHEIQNLLEMAQALERQLDKIRTDMELPRPARLEIGRLHRSAEELRRALERQAAYLVNIVTPDARRRRSRQKLREIFESAYRLVARQAERREIQLANSIPDDLKSPPMFRAEMVAVFANLLTNAVKASRTPGKIRAKGRAADHSVVLRLENTGTAVDPAEGEKWFRPFQSTTADVDPSLGQGMGLGLTITRSILEEYGAMIQFVRPGRGYATALEITFPAKGGRR